jgi:hypothetical protein
MPSPTPTPTVTKTATSTAGTAPANSIGGGRYGIAIGGGLASLDAAGIRSRLNAIKQMGINRVRFDVNWSDIQAGGSSSYNWSGTDNVVSIAAELRMSLVAIITYTPTWARISGCDSEHCRPQDPAVFGQFAGTVAARYAARGLHIYEIWNEPNWSEFWLPKPDPVAYTTMLRSSYQAIKRADGAAFVLSGGFAQADTTSTQYSAPDFLKGMYANGAKSYFDAISNHPYTFPYLPSYQWSWNKWLEMGTSVGVRGVMTANGDSAKQVWITEVGAATNGPGSIASNGAIAGDGAADHVTEALQARLIQDIVNLSKGTSWIGPIFWYTYQDDGTDTSSVEHFFGLVRPDGSHKPAYDVVKKAAGL